MNKTSHSVSDAARLFLASLCDYQAATRDMNLGLQKLNSHLIDFAGPLSALVARSGGAVAPTRREH